MALAKMVTVSFPLMLSLVLAAVDDYTGAIYFALASVAMGQILQYEGGDNA